MSELRLAFRWLRKRPGFAVAAVTSLALGIGANAAVFSLIDAVLFRPFPVRNQHELVSVRVRAGTEEPDGPSMPDYRDYRESQDVFAGLLAHRWFEFSISTGERTERASGELVSWNYFQVLGVPPVRGRDFLRVEDETRSPVVVISHRLWRRSFGEDPDVIGMSFLVNGQRLTVVGIAPAGFLGVDVGNEMDLWIPFSMLETLWPRVAEFFGRRDQSGLAVIGRLRSGVSPLEAEAALKTIAAQLAEAYPETNRDTTAIVVPFDRARIADRGAAVSYFGMLLAVVVLVLLIACSNVAGLRAVELSARESELAMRRALGATRLRLARQLMVENLLLYGVALAASLLVARFCIRVLETLTFSPVPLGRLDLHLDHRVLAFAAALALGAGVVFSVVPVLRARPSSLPGRSPSSGSGHRSKLLRGLVVTQFALSSALLVGTGLLLRSLERAYAVDPGYRLENVLFLSVDLQSMGARYGEARTQQFFRQVLERVSGVPGVRAAAWSADIPFERMTIRTLFVPESPDIAEEPDWLTADADIVTPDYLKTMGIALVRGRDLEPTDSENAPGVVLINETMALRYWPGEDALGKRIRVWSRMGIRHAVYEVVGIVRDVRYHGLFEKAGPYVYYALAQRFFQNMNLHVHVAGDPMVFLPAVREAIRDVDDDLPVFDARPLSEERAISLSRQRTAVTLLGVSGLLALALTILGTYSVTAYAVSRRTSEVGVRMALGAKRADILRLILGQGFLTIAIGLGFGVFLSALMSGQMEALLLGIERYDAATYVGCFVLLAVAAAVACYVPARRAASIDPSTALRYEA